MLNSQKKVKESQNLLGNYGIYDPIYGTLIARPQLGKANKTNTESEKMVSLRKAAEKYESKKTLNICDLKEVSTEMDLVSREFTKEDGEKFTVQVVVIDEKEYRVPSSVIEQLQTLMEENEGVTKFKVVRKGEGMKTKYTVIPLD